MQINPEKLSALAAEWDPTPFVQAMETASAMPVGAAVPPVDQGDFSWVGNATPPGQPKVPQIGAPAQQQAAMGLMQQPKPGMAPPPGAMPQGPGPAVQYPGLPKIGQVPSLGQILAGRSA